MKIYYLTVEGITSTVFDSQVLGLVDGLADKGWQVNLMIGQKVKSRFSVAKSLSLVTKKLVRFIFLGSVLNHDKVAKKILKKLPKSDSILLHCRNVEAAYIGLLVKEKSNNKIQIVYDVRGYVEQEKAFFNEPERELLFRAFNDKLFISNIYFSFVSQELFNVYNEKYNIPKEKVIFCNSGYNDSIFLPPNEVKTKNTGLVKVLFVGGNQKYQRIEEIILAIKDKEGVELTVVTPQPLKIKNTYNNVVFLNNLSQNEINNLSNEFDYGVIYRTNELFNQVATPTKISEYLGKGLKVLAINSAGAYSKLFSEDNKLGFLFKSDTDLMNIKLEKVSLAEKQVISKYAKQHLSLSANVNKYIKLYEKINKSL